MEHGACRIGQRHDVGAILHAFFPDPPSNANTQRKKPPPRSARTVAGVTGSMNGSSSASATTAIAGRHPEGADANIGDVPATAEAVPISGRDRRAVNLPWRGRASPRPAYGEVRENVTAAFLPARD